jgi:preprotein translocase subunit SecG
MDTLVTVIHVIVCLFLILVVLLQAGKGGGMGIAFGGGGSGSVFGGSGAGNFLTRLTVAAAIGFMLTSMSLAYFASHEGVDPLKQLSEQSRRAQKEREAAKQQIVDSAAAKEAAKPALGEVPDESLIELPQAEGAAPGGAGEAAADTAAPVPGQAAAPPGGDAPAVEVPAVEPPAEPPAE